MGMEQELDDIDDVLDGAEADNDAPDDEDFAPAERREPETEDDEPAQALPPGEDPVAKAREVAAAWEQEQAAAKAALAQAEQEWVATEKRFDNDEADHAARLKAQQAIIDARVRVTEAERETGRARQYAEQAQASQPSQAAQAWVARNPRFQNDARFKAQADQAFAALVREGYDPNNPKLYERLDQKLRSTPRMQGRAGASGAPVVRSGERGDTGPELTGRDREWMGKFGINPANKLHAKTWMNNKRELAKRLQQGR